MYIDSLRSYTSYTYTNTVHAVTHDIITAIHRKAYSSLVTEVARMEVLVVHKVVITVRHSPNSVRTIEV